MSRRRYISSDISVDGDVALLAEASPDYLEVVIWILGIPIADDWGRLTGEPNEFKIKVCPGFPVGLARIEEAIQRIADKGLWQLYGAPGHRVIAYKWTPWLRAQSYLPREKRVDDSGSRYPAPPDWPAAITAQSAADQGPSGKNSPTTGGNPKESPQIAANQRSSPKNTASPSPSPSPSPSSDPSDQAKAASKDDSELTPQQLLVRQASGIFEAADLAAPTPGQIGQLNKAINGKDLLALLRRLYQSGGLGKGHAYVLRAAQNEGARPTANGSKPQGLGGDEERSRQVAALEAEIAAEVGS